jgi:hypothetical protein
VPELNSSQIQIQSRTQQVLEAEVGEQEILDSQRL